MTYCVVNNVNSARSKLADYDVHREGCRDLSRISEDDIYFRGSRSVQAAIDANIEDDRGDFGEDAEDFTYNVKPCCNVNPDTNNNTTEEVTRMSTRTANRVKKNTTTKEATVKSTAKKVTKPAPKPRTQKTKTITLPTAVEKRNSVQFKPKSAKGSIVTAVYVKKSLLALLDDDQKTATMTFDIAESQPKNSVRFNERGDDIGIGSLYLVTTEAAKVGITAKTKAVKVTLERAGQGVKLTVTVA